MNMSTNKREYTEYSYTTKLRREQHLPKTAKMKVMSPSNGTCDIVCAKYPSLLRPHQANTNRNS